MSNVQICLPLTIGDGAINRYLIDFLFFFHRKNKNKKEKRELYKKGWLVCVCVESLCLMVTGDCVNHLTREAQKSDKRERERERSFRGTGYTHTDIID
jgi:hypothetical protein